MDQDYWSWTEEKSQFLIFILIHLLDVCWSIAPTRHLDSIYKVKGSSRQKSIFNDFALSIQEVIDGDLEILKYIFLSSFT